LVVQERNMPRSSPDGSHPGIVGAALPVVLPGSGAPETGNGVASGVVVPARITAGLNTRIHLIRSVELLPENVAGEIGPHQSPLAMPHAFATMMLGHSGPVHPKARVIPRLLSTYLLVRSVCHQTE